MIKTHTLKNGITVVMENLPHFSSVTLGVWVKTGSVFENQKENGISHVIEHMLFKGTKSRSAKDIAIAFDKIGGQVNAFTGKEATCYYAKVVASETEVAVDVLSDLVKNAVLDEGELDKERFVILEEIAMINDQPDELAHEQVSVDFFKGSELSKPIIGPAENVRGFTRKDLTDYIGKHYHPENMVISVAGKMDEAAVLALIEQYFGDVQKPKSAPHTPSLIEDFSPHKNIRFVERDIEQTHIALGFNGVSYNSDDRMVYMVLSNLFGGSMSSRLFQSIREELGLVYSVYSYLSAYVGAGMFGIYAGTGAKTAKKALARIFEEINKVKTDGVPKEEFLNSKTQLHGNYMLSLESTSARMQALGKSQTLLGHVDSQEETLRKLEAVTLDDIHRVVPKIFDFDSLNADFVGNIADKKALAKLCE
ncbi:MAG: pitrilysin family protein [Eubacteriales bacterium]